MIEIQHINQNTEVGLLNLDLFNLKANSVAKRVLEKEGIKYLLSQLNINYSKLCYNQNNKPFLLDNERYISISHSHKYLAIIINKKNNTGIDIELIRPKILNIKQKFCNINELNYANNSIEMLTCIWSAKETVYKINGIKGISFSEQIKVNQFNINQSTITVSIFLNNNWINYNLALQKIENYYLTYLLNEI
ncbi:MAG: 4'-phosphopantetheinyl transferase superfamily protein [Bacteroidetes bacterium]|nr:4'-phosphopantetheinyl transferase superfamily protein [Bacteroidota bacterium]